TGGGLVRYNRHNSQSVHFMYQAADKNGLGNNNVLAISQDQSGNIWIGSENESLSHNSVHSIARDAFGGMWVGTFAGGVNYFTNNTGKFTHFKHTSDSSSL